MRCKDEAWRRERRGEIGRADGLGQRMVVGKELGGFGGTLGTLRGRAAVECEVLGLGPESGLGV